MRDGLRVVIAGPPNAGKSSLLNALAKRDVAIVSEEAGTTRDVIEVHLDLGGVPVMLIDTAGLRDAEGRVEEEGIRRALARAGDADLVLWLVDATAPQWDAPCRPFPTQIRANSGKARADPGIEQDRPGAGRRSGQGGCRSLGQDRRGHRQIWSRRWPRRRRLPPNPGQGRRS